MEISSHLTLVPSTGLMVKGTEMSSPPTLLKGVQLPLRFLSVRWFSLKSMTLLVGW